MGYMALEPPMRVRLARVLAISIALLTLTTVGLAALPARATYISMSVAPGMYTGTNVYVPGETMEITLTASNTPPNSYDVTILDFASGTPTQTITNQTVGTSGQKTIPWSVPGNWPDGATYRVEVRYAGSAGLLDVYYFAIQQYQLRTWTDRAAYLPGDTVTVSWSATLLKDGSPAASGVGAIQVWNPFGTAPLVPQHNFTASQGSYGFALSTSQPTNQQPWIYTWFNDTAGLRTGFSVNRFVVRGLGLIVQTDKGAYVPSDIVLVSISTKASPNPSFPSFFDPAAPGVSVNVSVTDLSTGNPVPAYGKTQLVTDSNGQLVYAFQLAASPTKGTYEVDGTATAHLQSTTASTTFTVGPMPTLVVQESLDKSSYLSGDTLHATAATHQSTSGNLTYAWQVIDQRTGNTLANLAGGNSTYTYTIGTGFQGFLIVRVTVNDGNGNTATDSASADVAFGYLSLSLSPTQYNPGDTLSASFALFANPSVMSNPTYFWSFADSSGATVASGNTSGAAGFVTPNPASTYYLFTVTATASGRSVTAMASSTRAGGYLLSVSLDKSSYNPGDVVQISYTIIARGTSALPSAYAVYANVLGVGTASAMSTSPTGTLSLRLPQGVSSGDLILYIYEAHTGAFTYASVHIGSVNPLMTSVAGIPAYDILLTLLFLVVLLGLIVLWRRGGGRMGRAPPAAASRAAPPPPPSGGPPPATSPMSVACKNCGASIEITTSKRPIEVMCPSCGETQVVQ